MNKPKKRPIEDGSTAARIFSEAVDQESAGNMRRAAGLYADAARLGHPYAQNNLGALFSTGRGVQKSATKALHWWRLAARHNLEAPIFNVGMSYLESGQFALALRWFLRGAEAGDGDAHLFAAKLMLQRGDIRSARLHLKRALLGETIEEYRDEARELLAIVTGSASE